ncbi:fimbria/pilus outer membrane usher protein [Alcaligenes phenolicus]|uniref:fimbria/pilus outer membrane usher protein n=1 Tax=Alcaligenes phenolicus TaxID=232846 RepID=UPI002AA9229C|nr:fimbria/pilus outer membrane usher protein [Alcaligenes phenolicus]
MSFFKKAAGGSAWICIVHGVIVPACLHPVWAHAQSETAHVQQNIFDLSLIRGASQADLSRLGQGENQALPGVYALDVTLNGDGVGRFDIQLHAAPSEPSGLVPRLTSDQLQRLGLTQEHLLSVQSADLGGLWDIKQIDTQASAILELEQLALKLSIPQVYLKQEKRGYVDESYWDYGVNAGFVNYQANLRHDQYSGVGRDNVFLGLNGGINVAGWRLRNESSVTRSPYGGTQLTSNRTFLQHDVPRLKSQFSAGELYSNANVFNSVRFQGVQLSSDDGMLADSERGYAPIVHGIAESNATVEVRQNGYLLYSANVPPGPFRISDIHPSGSNGDLEVSVIETDGSRRVFVQAFSALPLMVRKGRLRYSVEAGRYKSNVSELDTPAFVAASGTYGLTENLSLTGGMQLAKDFSALSVGVGGNTPVGAVSLDVTNSFSRLHGQMRSGQSIRALYAKTLASTNTTVTLAAYRYSTSGYRTFENHVVDLYNVRQGAADGRWSANSRTRFDLNISQSLGENSRYGNFYVNALQESFWGGRTMRSFSAGYGNTFKGVAYNLSASRAREIQGLGNASQNTVMLTLAIPLGRSQHSPRVSASYEHSGNGGHTSASIYGYVPGEHNINLSAQLAHSERGQMSGSAGISADLPAVSLGTSFGIGKNYHSASLNARGAVVVHGDGLNFSRSVGDGFALVHVDGVQGVGVGNGLARTAANGYAVYPTTQPYRFNTIRLDSGALGADVELDSLSKKVVPHRGAIVKAEFKGTMGRRVQLRLRDDQGQPLPLGAEIQDAQGNSLGLVDHNSQALVLLSEDQGHLQAVWGETHRCQADYLLAERDPARYYDRINIVCKP